MQDLRIGIVQNVISNSSTYVYDNPRVTSNAFGVQGNLPTQPVPVRYSITYAAGSALNPDNPPLLDSLPADAPLVSMDPAALAVPFGLPLGAAAMSNDSPQNTPDATATLVDNILDKTKPFSAEVTYTLARVVRHAKFRTWAVLFDTKTKTVIAPLSETTWDLDVSGGNPGPQLPGAAPPAPQVPVPLGHDFAPVSADGPVLKRPYANGADLPIAQVFSKAVVVLKTI